MNMPIESSLDLRLRARACARARGPTGTQYTRKRAYSHYIYIYIYTVELNLTEYAGVPYTRAARAHARASQCVRTCEARAHALSELIRQGE